MVLTVIEYHSLPPSNTEKLFNIDLCSDVNSQELGLHLWMIS